MDLFSHHYRQGFRSGCRLAREALVSFVDQRPMPANSGFGQIVALAVGEPAHLLEFFGGHILLI